MLKQIALYSFLGKPLLAYAGLVALVLFLATATVPIWNQGQEKKIPLHWHLRLARIAIAFGIIHAVLAIALFAK